MRILLTFTGFHDPFSPTIVEKARQIGPVLSVLHHIPFDAVYLFDTPGAHDNTLATIDQIKTRFPSEEYRISEVDLAATPFPHIEPRVCETSAT